MDWQQPPPAGAAPGAATQLPPPVTTGSAAAPPHHAKTTQMVRPPVPLGPVAAAPTKRVGRKGAGRRIMSVGAAEPEELVKLGPEISRTSERLRTGWRPVQLSAEDKATPVVLDDRQLTASSSAGYSMVSCRLCTLGWPMAFLRPVWRRQLGHSTSNPVHSTPAAAPQVRATHGAFTGTWYYEVKVDQLGPTGAARSVVAGRTRVNGTQHPGIPASTELNPYFLPQNRVVHTARGAERPCGCRQVRLQLPQRTGQQGGCLASESMCKHRYQCFAHVLPGIVVVANECVRASCCRYMQHGGMTMGSPLGREMSWAACCTCPRAGGHLSGELRMW